MRPRQSPRTTVIAALLLLGAVTVPAAHAQGVDELKRRIEELERSTREQVDTLKRMIEQQETERAKERRAPEEREQRLRALQEQVQQQQLSLPKQEERVPHDLQACSNSSHLHPPSRQSNN